MATITRVAGTPLGSVAAAVEAVGGVEEEYFLDGIATRYGLVEGTGYSPDGRWLAEPAGDPATFRTRMLVVRPGDPATFNGDVVVVWNNVSGGESFMPPNRVAQMLQDGYAVVGVSAQVVGVEGPAAGHPAPESMPSLKRNDPARYGDLHHPGDDYCWDIYTQAGQLLGPDRPRDLDPLGGLEVEHLIATGGSQSAARLASYLNAVQPLAGAYDAFLLVVYPNAPTALNAETTPAEVRQAGPGNTTQLLPWHEQVTREDLDVPIIVLNSEWESAECWPNHQDDTELLRWWEVTGSGHVGSAGAEEMEMMASMGFAGSTVSFAPANRAALHALHRWIRGGAAPPHQPRLVRAGDTRVLARDEQGNALGGIRFPDLEAPLGTHVGENLTDNIAAVGGSSTPFPPEKVKELYPDHDAWFAKYQAAVEHLVESEVVLPDDAERMLARARAFSLPT